MMNFMPFVYRVTSIFVLQFDWYLGIKSTAKLYYFTATRAPCRTILSINPLAC